MTATAKPTKRLILVVEDDELVAKSYRFFFSRQRVGIIGRWRSRFHE